MYLDHLRPELSQGDVLTGLPVVQLEGGQPVIRNIRAVIISHTCDIMPGQKRRSTHALVAEFRDRVEATGGLWGTIAAGRAYSAYYMAAKETAFGPGFADFNRIYRVERAVLEEHHEADRRTASMDDDHQKAIIYALANYMTREGLDPSA